MKPRSPLETLARTPRRFGFDAAIRILTLARRTQDPAEVAHFRSPPGLTYPPADVLEFRGEGRPDVTVGMIGLTGPSGVLPRHYTDAVVQALRNRSSSLHAFLDTLSHRFVAFFARAGAKYRPARAAESAAVVTPPVQDPISGILLALTGHGTAHLTERMLIGTEPLLHYAGLFAMRPRSAARLGAMVSDWLGMQVEVIEFAGAWLTLPPDQRTRIGAIGQFNRLSADSAAGVRAWDPQARVVLRIGPLDRAGFERLLPDRLALQRLVSLVRTFVGFEIGFAINPVLAATAVPPLRLDALADPAPRLGWNTWLEPMAGGRRRLIDAGESVFEAEIIEAQSLIKRGTGGMSGWGGGYVTDVPYTIGWYRQQSPVMMALASIVGGAAANIPAGDDPVMVLELGCGFGYGAMALAASNPSWNITAVDFNPAHIAEAREWADAAGLTNVTFVEADFSTWEDHPVLSKLPEMDFVTMHGIWSWIPPSAQKGIVRLLSQKVRPGGLVHLSYNTLPGWQDTMGAARLIHEGGQRAGGRSDQMAREGLKLLKDMVAAEAHFAISSERTKAMVKTLDDVSSRYLAHEFMNGHWAPCFAADVAAALSEAKLEFVGVVNLAENFPELMMTDAQREIFNRYSDPAMQELIKDMCIPRRLRHDVFVRGARRINLNERSAALMDISLTLVKPPEELPDSVAMPAGRADLSAAFYRPIVQALSEGPKRVSDLLALPDLVGRRDNPAEMIAILIAVDMAEPTIRPNTEPGPEAIRFNTVTTRRMISRESPQRPVAAACRPTGMPVIAPLMALAVVDLMRSGVTGLDELVAAMHAIPEQEPEVRKSIEACLNRFVPMLKSAGVF